MNVVDCLHAEGVPVRHGREGNQRLPCPRCNKRAPDDALSVTIEPDGGFVWQCFRCGWTGGSHGDDWVNEYAAADAEWRFSKAALRSAAILERNNGLQAEKEAGQAQAAERAVRMWQSSRSAPSHHPYAVRKGLDVTGLRFAQQFQSRRCALLISMRDRHGNIVNLQGIDPEGKKRFLKGARTPGAFALVGTWRKDSPPYRIAIGEGYATTAAFVKLHPEFRGVAAMSAKNLLATAEIMRDKFPSTPITIAADRDVIGALEAGRAAMAIGADIEFPQAEDFAEELVVAHG